MVHTIGFPGLNISLEINRVAFSLWGKDVFWYGIIIGAGVLLATYVALRDAHKAGIKPDYMLDMIMYGIVLAIIGARLYYVAFNPSNIHSFWDVFKIWEGGIAIYGGIIGGILGGYIYARIKKIYFPTVLDVTAIPFMIGQAVGRWGNFFNQEAYGAETDLPWRMSIINEFGQTIFVHPTFLYESLWNIIGIVIVANYRKIKAFEGELFAVYVAWYGLGRAWIEGLRTDSLYIFGIFRVSQVLAILSSLVAIAIIIWMRNRKSNTGMAE